MEGTDYCVECGCYWEKHMHITCTYYKVQKVVIDSNRQREINSRDAALAEVKAALERMRTLVAEYKAEYEIIQDVSSKFAYLLTENALIVSLYYTKNST